MFLLSASMFLIITSKIMQIKVDNIKKTHKIQDGKITYADLDSPAKPFFQKSIE